MLRKKLALVLALAVTAASGTPGRSSNPDQIRSKDAANMMSHPYLGMWVTKDGHIRHQLLPNGRYDEARGARRSAYQGRYEIRGTDRIEYWDDTGFTADGQFIDGVLHHAGMLFYREGQREPRP